MKFAKFFCVLAIAGLFFVPVMAEDAAPAEGAEVQQEESCWCVRALRATGIYFANIFSDAADIVSFEITAGAPFEADLFATHFCEIGWEYTDTYFAGWNFGRQFGVGRRESQRAAFLAWSSDYVYVSQTAGWMHDGVVLKDREFNFQRWDKPFYRDRDRDFWAFGGRIGLFFGADVEFHPVALADFLCALAAQDISDDNWK